MPHLEGHWLPAHKHIPLLHNRWGILFHAVIEKGVFFVQRRIFWVSAQFVERILSYVSFHIAIDGVCCLHCLE